MASIGDPIHECFSIHEYSPKGFRGPSRNWPLHCPDSLFACGPGGFLSDLVGQPPAMRAEESSVWV